MKVHVVQQYGHDSASSCNEFDEPLWPRRDADNNGWLETQSRYTLVLEASLRDREFDETKRELNKCTSATLNILPMRRATGLLYYFERVVRC